MKLLSLNNKTMIVKDEKFLTENYAKSLSDDEILSTIIFCKNLIEKKDLLSTEEFLDICFFFFDGDETFAKITLCEIKNMYVKEYMQRRIN